MPMALPEMASRAAAERFNSFSFFLVRRILCLLLLLVVCGTKIARNGVCPYFVMSESYQRAQRLCKIAQWLTSLGQRTLAEQFMACIDADLYLISGGLPRQCAVVHNIDHE
ncbi:hypothetical protein I4X03_007470 [Massilia sp. R798]|uniref:Secreted protein n=1 Tax=Massilia soli TaxID=2792854 RepID=A0ABS7SLN9_9BURK|nr:hypothetical protein [Massilia soli]